MNILLDYLFPISSIEPTPAASTAFLKQVCVLVSPVVAAPHNVILTKTSKTAVASLTLSAGATAEINQLFDAGLSKVYILPLDGLDDLAAQIEGHESDFFTILVSSDFANADVTTDLDAGDFEGVIGVQSTDDSFLTTQAAIANRSAWHTTSANKGKNMFYAFGKMLSNSLSWRNQQYISMPVADDVATLGDAETLFDAKICFVISDTQFSNRLSLFVAGGKAIVAPYIKRNLQIDMQSAALTYISANQPAYTRTQAALVEDELQKVVARYILDQRIEAGVVEVSLEEDNFVASGSINIAEPKALWRIFAEMRASL